MKKLQYLEKIMPVIERINEETEEIEKAAQLCADAIHNGKFVYVFGTGYSSIAVQDIFPRSGSNIGYKPILDEHLMWTNVKSIEDVKALQDLEKKEGYIDSVLDRHSLKEGEVIIIFSHSGNKAVVLDAAIYAKRHGCKVIAISSLDNYKYGIKPVHSSGKRLKDVADLFINNGCPLTDGLVELKVCLSKVGASSTIGALLVGQSIVSETSELLEEMGHKVYALETQTVEFCPRDWTAYVFGKYLELERK